MAKRILGAMSDAWQWVLAHPYTLAGALALLVVSIPFYFRQEDEWERVFVGAARHLWDGQDIYRPEDAYLYPPFMAWATLPFLALPPATAKAAWLLVNLACLVLMVRWGWRLAEGGPLEGENHSGFAEHIAAWLGLVGALPYIQNCLAHKQTDLFIGALLFGGCLLLRKGKPLLGATFLGLAAANKCTPLLFLPYLVWRRRPRAAAWLLAVAVGVNLLPDLVHRSPTGRPWLADFAVRYLRPLTESDHYLGSWGSDIGYNQSLSGAGQRWLATTWVWTEDDCLIRPRENPPSPRLLRGAVHGVEFVLLLVTIWASGRPFRGRHGGDQNLDVFEYCAVLLLMLLLSPMSSKAHFGILLLPGFCLARAAASSRSPLLVGLALAATALGVLSNKDPLGEQLYTLTLWYGSVTWQTLLLLAGCLFVLARGKGAGRLAMPASVPAEGRPVAA